MISCHKTTLLGGYFGFSYLFGSFQNGGTKFRLFAVKTIDADRTVTGLLTV
jgi:hypothetical protein